MLIEQEVLEGLEKAGFTIPRSRFENWRERGLIVPIGTRKGLGQAKGRVAHLYRDGAIEQAVEIAQMRRQNLDLDEIGWRLWLAGREVGQKCWFPVFEFMARRFDECARAVREQQASDEFVDGQIEQMIAAAFKTKTSNRFFKQMRKALGPKRFAAVMNEVASMATGVFQSISSQTEQQSEERLGDERAMDVALGLKHARTDIVAGVGPVLPADYSPILQATFEPLEGASLTEYLDSIDPDHLRKTASSLLTLLRSIAEASSAFDDALANDAFGLRRAALLARMDRNIHACTALIWTLVKERSREKFHDLDAMAKLFLSGAIGARKFVETAKTNRNLKGLDFHRTPYKSRPRK